MAAAVSLTIQLDRQGGVYKVGESVRGAILVTTKERCTHSGITITVDGNVALQLSPKSVGIFEAFYHSIKPLQLIHADFQICGPGKFEAGKFTIPFEFDLVPQKGSPGLFETYHGVFVNVLYTISVDMIRGMFAKGLRESIPFIVMNPGQSCDNIAPRPVTVTLEPSNLRNFKRPGISQQVPQFRIQCSLDSAVCNIGEPLTGEVRVINCDTKIKSIEIQLVRVEFCAAQEGVAKEATEIQNIQIADGDVCRDLAIPIYMMFPRWFTCPTLVAQNFKVEFEVNLVIILEGSVQITENFPIKLYRIGSTNTIYYET